MKKIALAFFFFVVCLGRSFGNVYAGYQVDSTFPVVDGDVNAIAEDSSYVYVVGNFNLVGAQKKGFAVLYDKATNTIENFDEVPTGTVYAAVPDGLGGWYVGGDFGNVGSHSIKNLVHIKADKTIDLSWTPNPNGIVYALYFDGVNVYVGGNFTQIGGQSLNRLAKVNKDTGSPDLGWNPNPNGYVHKIVKDGSYVYIAGFFSNIGGVSWSSLARIEDSSGNLDSGWNPNPNGTVDDFAVSSSHIYAVGNFSMIGGAVRYYAAKLNKTTGIADASWHPNLNARATVIRLNLDDGEVYIGGYFTYISAGGGAGLSYLAKVNDTDGSPNASWSSTYVSNYVSAILVSGSDVYVGGNFNNLNQDGVSYLIDLSKSTGAKAASWNFNFSDKVRVLEEYGGKVFVGGEFGIGDGLRRKRIARILKSTKEVDVNWNPNPAGSVSDIAVDNDAVYVGGQFYSIGGQPKSYVAKLNKTNGNADPSWTHDLSDVYEIKSISLSDSDVYVGGSFDVPYNLAKLTKASGSLVSWYPDPNAAVERVLFRDNGVYLGGYFSAVGGQSRMRLAKLDAVSGGAVAGWNPSANDLVRALFASDSGLFVGGDFSTIGGQPRTRIAKIDSATGIVEAGWNVNLNNVVRTISGDSTHIYFGGDFTTLNGNSVGRIARVRQDNAQVDDNFVLQANGAVNKILVDAYDENKVYVGGAFSSFGGNNYARRLSLFTYVPEVETTTSVVSQSTSQANVSSENKASSFVCSDSKPSSAPDLFQIDVKDTSAKLYFSPMFEADEYYVSFAEKENAEQHGAFVKLGRAGVQSYEVFFLKPNTTYYFKVRGQNGCSTGDWSQIIKVKTNRKGVKKSTPFYKYQLVKKKIGNKTLSYFLLTKNVLSER